MKKLYTFTISLLLIINLAKAQAPQGFKYQASIRDNNGVALLNKLVAIKISLLAGTSNGTIVYSEIHNVVTTDFGIINLNIGSGIVGFGNFNSIDWGSNTYFIKTEVDVNNGTNFLFIGTSQLLSVPYAMFAAKSGNAANDKDQDSLNELQTINLNGNNLQLNKNGGSVDLTKYTIDNNTDSQTISLNGNTLAISRGNFVKINDIDSTNELQTINLNGNNLQLSKNGGNVDLTKYDKDSQQLVLNGNTLSITRGNSIVLSGAVDLDADPTNEIQNLSLSKDTLKLSKANFIVLPNDNDADSTNEIQTLNVYQNILSLTKSNQVNIDADTTNEIQSLNVNQNKLIISKGNQVNIDADTSNEIQSLTYRNDSLFLSKSNFVKFTKDNDRDSLNELQLLSRSNDTIFLSKGNFVVLPASYNPFTSISLKQINYSSNKVFKILDSGATKYIRPEFGNCTLFDSLGNFYFAGNYLGVISVGGIQIISNQSNGFFLAKFNNLGIRQWVNNYPNVNAKLVNFIIDLNADIILLTSDHGSGLSTLTKAIIYKVSKTGTNSWNQVFQTSGTWLAGNKDGTHKSNIGLCIDKLNNIYTVNTLDNINSMQVFSLFKINTNTGGIISEFPISTSTTYAHGWIQNIFNIFSDDSNNIYIQAKYNESKTQNLWDVGLGTIIIRVNNNGTLRYISTNGFVSNCKIVRSSLNNFIGFDPSQNIYNINLQLPSYTLRAKTNYEYGIDFTQNVNYFNNLKHSYGWSNFLYLDSDHIFPENGFKRNYIIEFNNSGEVDNVKSICTIKGDNLFNTVIDKLGNSYFFIKFPTDGLAYVNSQKIGNDSIYLIQ